MMTVSCPQPQARKHTTHKLQVLSASITRPLMEAVDGFRHTIRRSSARKHATMHISTTCFLEKSEWHAGADAHTHNHAAPASQAAPLRARDRRADHQQPRTQRHQESRRHAGAARALEGECGLRPQGCSCSSCARRIQRGTCLVPSTLNPQPSTLDPRPWA
jgi:hypothetical protein